MKKNTKGPITWFVHHPYYSGFIVFFFVFILSSIIAKKEFSLAKEEEEDGKIRTLQIVQQNIEQSLKSSYISTITLALTIGDDKKPKKFETVAQKIMESNEVIDGVRRSIST
ncbi:hypothetical protein [Mesonia maritima]|uniref:Uncharacterized protein n=1 Tax=Mesonia maritima TaxID=1793873 RepID=A0ABU1K4L3_9FLAO|nr:hypothetical protein [Mesonia maritima]MDR6299518.1 hypothetical protein [Mesonia maritima]